MREVIKSKMLLKVFVRKFDGGGNVIKTKVQDARGNEIETSLSDLFYMDLTSEEERKLQSLRTNGVGQFAFEVVLQKDIENIPVKFLHEGERKKEQIFKLFEPVPATKTPGE